MDDDEAVRLRRAVIRLARLFNTLAGEENLTPTQASVVGVVAVRGPLPLAEVARVEGLSPSMLSRVVAALDERGLVRRTPDPKDLRSARLTITAEGRKVHKRLKGRRAAALSSAAALLSAEDHDALIRALPALEALAPPAPRSG